MKVAAIFDAVVSAVALLAFTSQATAAPAPAKVDFGQDIAPILAARCLMCHGSQVQMSGLRLDRRADALKGGESGVSAITPGASEESRLIRYVAGLDPEIVMPPTGERLSEDQVALLRAWIDAGAIWEDPLAEDGVVAGEPTMDHWAFQPIRQPAIPEATDSEWVRNPIDSFVLARLREHGWEPGSPAEPHEILRRIYLGVIGIPPTLAEQEAFLADPSPEALDRVVDQLLARPGYGERWGRHWMDLVRYAETNGYERDAAKPEVWRYRDYVIRSLMGDKPFDQFAREQLAGDELEPVTPESLVATGYYRLGPWDDEPADPKQDRFDQLDDIIRTTSEVFLGLTVGCARCHDHKFDPIAARDYYGMAAVFNGLERPRDGRTELTLPIGTRDELAAEAERDTVIAPILDRMEEYLKPFRTELLKSGKSSLPPIAVEAWLVEPGARTVVQEVYAKAYAPILEQEVRAGLPDEARIRIESLEKEIGEIKEGRPDLPRGYFMHESRPEPPAMHLLKRGSAHSPGEQVAPAAPAVLVGEQLQFRPGSPTSRRRLTFANWLVSDENPLTARVIVNRVWQHHFGNGLVRTPSNFGRIGQQPTHPELLDWLASWFRREGWSLKGLHRLILTSNTYRMSKRWRDTYGEEDPENEYLWRVGRRRLDVEAVRDSMLAASGHLNRTMFGPSMYPRMPEAVLSASKKPDEGWQASDEAETSRRTLYAHVKRSMILPMLEVLDFCDTTRSTGERLVSTVAPQALTLFNGEFVNRQAKRFAHRILREAGSDPYQQVEYAYRLALARPPSAYESGVLVDFLQEESAQSSQDEPIEQGRRLAALAQMGRVIFNLNEFAYTD